MKGPGLRLRNDVRRCWRCPDTGNLLKTPGAVTHLYSPFVKQASWMKLEEDEPIARNYISLETILGRMDIVIPEEEEVASEKEEIAETEPASEETSEAISEETAEAESSDEQELQSDSESDTSN